MTKLEGPLVDNLAHESHQSFTQDLQAIAVHANGEDISIAEIEQALHGRGFASICLVLCIPFIQPIPLPGLSVALGAAMIAFGLRLAVGSKGGLPQFIKRRRINTRTLQKIIEVATKLFTYIERFFKPRLKVMLKSPMLNLIGVSIMCCGFALSLPLPPVILFSNSLPAWGIIFLALGYLERDGVVIALGHLLTVATWIYFAFLWEAVQLGIESLLGYFKI